MLSILKAVTWLPPLLLQTERGNLSARHAASFVQYAFALSRIIYQFAVSFSLGINYTQMSAKDTIKTGFLTKSPPENKGPFYGWKRRFFMFIDSSRVYPFAPRHIRIEYYANLEESKSGNPLNSINLNDCSGVLKREPLKGHKHVFDIVTPTRVFHLSADTKEEREDWVDLLNTNIFAYNNINPMNQSSLLSDASMKQGKRSSGFQPDLDYTRVRDDSKSTSRSQSLRLKNTLETTSPQPMPDMFFPLFPNTDNPNSYSSNLKMLPQSPTSSDPKVMSRDASPRPSIQEHEIISAPGFTAVPQSQAFGLYDPSSSLPVTNESTYMNVGSSMQQSAGPPPCFSADSSPSHPSPMVPAPYKKFPQSNSTPGLHTIAANPVESEYSCIDSSDISDSVLLQYAKVQRRK